MKTVGLIPNPEKENALQAAAALVPFLQQEGCKPLLQGEDGLSPEALYAAADFIIALGGDGTLLRVGREAAPFGTPVIGVNFGHLGFLTDVEAAEAQTAIRRVLAGEYHLEKRMMLEAQLGEEKIIALNDVCITRGVLSKIVPLQIDLNGSYLETFKGDGVIICTPTGSTAYNLSAGGPVLKPDGRMVAITPICPHALHARSIVVTDSDAVEVTAADGGLFSADGQDVIPLSAGQRVRIVRAPHDALIIKTQEHEFYDILRSKLMQSGGANE